MFWIQAGVDISRLKRVVRRTLPKVQRVLEGLDEDLNVSSTYEGDHGAGSLHYCDEAYDIVVRLNILMTAWSLIKEELGDDFDVVAEEDHIHIEYDPDS